MVKRFSLVTLVGCLCFASAAPAVAGDFVTVGKTGIVKKAGNGFPCFNSKEDFDAYAAARSDGDRYGAAEAMQDAILLRPGWHVRLIHSEVGLFRGGHSALRVESGPKASAACWVKFNPAGIIE